MTTNTPLTRTDVDAQLDPAPLGPLSGDRTDDDATVLDEQFETMPVPPQEHGTSGKYETVDLPKPSRILSRSFPFIHDGTSPLAPVQAFAADVHRKELVIRVRENGGTNNARLAVASDSADVYNAVSILPTANVPVPEWRSTQHTGAVWLYFTASGGAATYTVDVWVVTE